MKHLALIFACLLFNLSFAQNIEVKGTVTDSDTNEPLPGVNIIIKNTTTGVTTDFDGNYVISNVPSNGTLIFSYLGYLTQEVQVQNRQSVNVVLTPDVQALGEVVVIGYG
ncbi:MAG TPA: carboxypeptidase-like regulatory domain-containing protein, partial [Mangrovimonas sp.]|nr:carboxypeptidase-like regulatory domain-containing protein [Mangrovimonas sp.]